MRYEGKILKKGWRGRKKKDRGRERGNMYFVLEWRGYILKNYFSIGKYFFL